MSGVWGAAVLLGPPASGKTSVANAVAERAGDIYVVEAGALLKQRAASDTDTGRQLRSYVDQGRLAPVDLVEPVIREAVEQHPEQHVVFDGFPRTEEQIDAWLRIVQRQGLRLKTVVILELTLAEAIERLRGRRVCSRCGAVYQLPTQPPNAPQHCDRCGGELIRREDDAPDTVRRRFEDYERCTLPVARTLGWEFSTLTYRQSGTHPAAETAERIVRWLQTDPPDTDDITDRSRGGKNP